MRMSALFAGLLLMTVSSWAEPLKLVVFGDSLTAGYQLAPEDAFPVQLEKALQAKGLDVSVTNASVSGDTTSGGLARLDWSVGEDVDAVIVELGANDMLRGLPPETTRKNLSEIVSRLKAKGVEVLVAGMMAQRNLGEGFAASFDGIFQDIATQNDAVYYPFFLEGVALDPALNLADGMHPNGEGVSVIVDNMIPVIETLLSRASAS
ncbi:arylesterase [Roseibium sp. CAU 1637]|uniref:Arylesterase n=2 Tax=Roseibium limicola TaxID=2816037 RepID=A0A939ETC6_9HYPH|nr:arylesterase [Roseibium limicola]